MDVGELREILSEIPDDYEVRSRAENAHLNEDEIPWQLNFSGILTKVKAVDSQRAVMLIRGFE